MSSTDPQDAPATAPPSTDLELMSKQVTWLRSQLDTVREDARRSAELAVRQVGPLDEWVKVVADYEQLANVICRTEFVPKDFRGKPEQTTATMMYGREIGLPPMTTLQNTYVVHGRVGMYAEQLRAMILAAGHEYVIEESTSDRCVMAGRRKGSDRWSTFTYTMDMAKSAGLYAQNEQYRKRPVEMLFARATGLLAHGMFPDVLRGMRSIEELQDMGPDEVDVDAPPALPATTEKATRTVGRAAKKTAPALKAAPPPQPDVVIPDETLPPLPGEVEAPPAGAGSESPAGPTPGEGRTAEPSTPAGPTDDAGEGSPPGSRTPDTAKANPSPASPTERHCPDFDPHGPHIWPDQGEDWRCIGVVPATDTGTGPVQDKPRTISPGTLRTLQARFKSLGYTDEPDDREARLRVAAVLGDVPGAELDSFKDLTQDQASQVLTVLGPLKDRGDVLELMVRASRPEDGA